MSGINASTVTSFIVAQQHAFYTISMLMMSSYMLPESAKLKNDDEFDFLIVGGGTAGCVIANRLVKANFKVLVLEAGDDTPIESFLPYMIPFSLRSQMDWNYTVISDCPTNKCRQLSRRIYLPIGKTLGGTSALNFMLTSRGNDRDYQRWATAANDSSWNFENLLPLFKRSERVYAPEIAHSHFGGSRGAGDSRQGNIAITVDNRTAVNPYLLAFQEIGNELVVDYGKGHFTGFSKPLLSVADNSRQGTVNGYLVPAYKSDSKSNPKLFVSKKTLVTKIVFDENKNAIGVMAKIKNEKPILLKAKYEVIVTAGAIKSPQLLMLSGIGDKKHLNEKNIKVVSDLPVGKNLQDNAFVAIIHKTRNLPPPGPINFFEYPAPFIVGLKSLNGKKYPKYGTFTYISNRREILFSYCAFVFDFQLDICDRFDQRGFGREIIYTHLFGLYPKSRGKLCLKTTNPKDAPIVNLGHYNNKEDLENTVKYIKDYLSIENSTLYKKAKGIRGDLASKYCSKPGTDDYWKCYARCMSGSLYNICGTCSLGSVVDSKLKVFGVNKLRVADASVIPNIVTGGIYQPTIVIAEKASDMIKQEWKK